MARTSIAAQKAEYNARIRDEKVKNGGFTDTEINDRVHQITELANELERTTGKTVSLHTKKKFGKVKFAQMIQENIQYLISEDYLTIGEKAFLFDITAIVGFKSNGLVETKEGIQYPLTQEAIANKVKKTRKNTATLIKGLIEKGIMARSESGVENNNVLAYAYFVNPNIIFNGDKNEVNETLKVIFSKANKKPILKKIPVKIY